MNQSTDQLTMKDVFRRTIPVVTYEGVTYVRVEEAHYVLDYSPRPVDAGEGEGAQEGGAWVGYELGQQIVRAVEASLEAKAAVKHISAAPFTDVMVRLQRVAEAELSAANDRVNTLNRISICRVLNLPE